MEPHPTLLFVPGAGGAGALWSPVASRLPASWPKTLLSLPGAGDQPHDPGIRSFGDLIAYAAQELDDRTDVIAHSMGGAVAIGLALRHPRTVRRLVLVATSGGIDVSAFGAADWRPGYRAEYPRAAPWIWEERIDHGEAIGTIACPTLLLWGDADPISPVAVGRRLAELLPSAGLHVLAGGTHDLAQSHADAVARLIADHLA